MQNERSSDLTWQVQWTTSTDRYPCLPDPVQFESWTWKLIQSQKSSVAPFALSVSPRILSSPPFPTYGVPGPAKSPQRPWTSHHRQLLQCADSSSHPIWCFDDLGRFNL